MFSPFIAWVFLVQGIHNTFSETPPVITKFLAYDLNQPGDVTSQGGFLLPCEASGTSPLHYRWQLNGTDIKYGRSYRLLPSGTLEGRSLTRRNSGKYQCFVKNDFGLDFSRELQVKVTVLGGFYFGDHKVAPVALGKPLEVPCPQHKPSFGVTYRWGGFDPSYPEVFRPFSEDKRIAVTLEGTLVIMFVTLQDVTKVNMTKGIVCEMATKENKTYSHAVSFQLYGQEYSGNKAPEIYFSPGLQEQATEGAEKMLYCLAVAKPPPMVTWTKDGETIRDDQEDFHFPAEHFGRLLIIPDVEEQHQGTYTCTASSADGSFSQASRATFLTVQAPPKWEILLPSKTLVETSKSKVIKCVARAKPKPQYRWFRNGREINASNSRVKVRGNVLELTNVETWHDAVYQCVAENSLGMNVTSTWINIQAPITGSRRESSGFQLWVILCTVLGVVLIVFLVVLLICYKRRKSRRNGEEQRVARPTSSCKDGFNEHHGSQPTIHTPSGILRADGGQRRPKLPPVPQYQTLDPPTIGVACYEPIDPKRDNNDSELYEKLDFRTMDTPQSYGTPNYAKPIPEYLELVGDTNLPPVHTASNRKSVGPEKQYYEAMEGGLNQVSDDRFHGHNSGQNYEPMAPALPKPDSLKYYEPMSARTLNANDSQPPDSPKYYEPMTTSKVDVPIVKSRGSSSSADYYQPMAENNAKQGTAGSSPQAYYVPMSQNSSAVTEKQTSTSLASPDYNKEVQVDGYSSKL